jgi:hypothetical protein
MIKEFWQDDSGFIEKGGLGTIKKDIAVIENLLSVYDKM